MMKRAMCLALVLAALVLAGCGRDEVEREPEITVSPTPEVTATPVPTQGPTPVPVVDFQDYQFFVMSNGALNISFKYPSHWINEPGKSSIRYTEPVEAGDTPAQLTVTSKVQKDKPRDRDMVAQMESFLTLVQEYVDDYEVGELKTDVQILGTDGLRQKYTARNRDTGEAITGYALMVYSREAGRIYLIHFTAPTADYDELSGVIDVIRESISTT